MYVKSKKGIFRTQKSAYFKVCALLSYKKHLILKQNDETKIIYEGYHITYKNINPTN